MCGIVGLLNFERRYPAEQVRRWTLAMREAITHRGPDDAGLWQSGDGLVCLGHRLSLSARPARCYILLNTAYQGAA